MNIYYYLGVLIIRYRIGEFYSTDGVNRFQSLREAVHHLDRLSQKVR